MILSNNIKGKINLTAMIIAYLIGKKTVATFKLQLLDFSDQVVFEQEIENGLSPGDGWHLIV